jgi:hypothetical protein
MLPSVEAGHVLVANKDGHTGSVAVDYGNFAAILNTNESAVCNAIALGERAELWRKDAEYKPTDKGYPKKLMRLDLQPAFFRPELAEPIPETRGGKRANAGRKPKCAVCPPNTPMRELTETTIKTYCMGCGECLDEVTTYKTRELMPDDAPVDAPVDAPAANVETNADEFKFEYADETPTRQAEHADEFKTETVYTSGTTLVSVLKKTRAELVPVALTETFDITAAIRLADTYAPAEDAGRMDYKTGLVHIYHGNPGKALELLPNILDERACAMLLHLANRPPALAPGLRE